MKLLSTASAWAARLQQARRILGPRPFPLQKPVVLQFPVIDICNSQCQMCRIWENKKSDDIAPEVLRTALRNPLFSEVSAVGLNGGEPTLRSDLATLTDALFSSLPKLRSISLITNAYKYKQVIERIGEVGAAVRRHGGTLDVMVSLDGYGELHDLVRGKPRNFQRAQYVIDFIKTSPVVDSVRIGCTIIKANVYGLADLFDYCADHGLYVKYRLGIPHQRLYTQNLLDPYALTEAEKYHVVEFLEGLLVHYERNPLQRIFYRSLIDQLVHGAPRRAGCDWQHRGATITSKGELLYCAVQSRSLGHVANNDSEALYFGNESHLRDIIQNHCDRCVHDYMGLPPRREYLEQMGRRILQRADWGGYARRVRHSLRPLVPGLGRRFAQRLARFEAIPLEPTAGASATLRVLVCGWYGTETLGDKAILGGIVRGLKAAIGGPIELTLVSLNPYVSRMTRRQMTELKGCSIVPVERGIALAGHVDLVLFGGGPLMALDQLAEMEALFAAAKRAGVPSIVAGCGVGPLGDAWHNASIGRLLALASVRIYRDAESRVQAAALGVDTRSDLVAEDPAFTWLHATRPTPGAAPAVDRAVLLLGLRAFPHAQYARHLPLAAREKLSRGYEAAVVDALERLVAQRPEVVILPMPMCTNHFGDDDRWFYGRLFRGRPALARHLDRRALKEELSPIDCGELFAEATAALAMRFHSLVFALGLGIPTLGIDYTLSLGKVHALAGRFGVPSLPLSALDGADLAGRLATLLDRPSPSTPRVEPVFTEALANALSRLGVSRRSQPISGAAAGT